MQLRIITDLVPTKSTKKVSKRRPAVSQQVFEQLRERNSGGIAFPSPLRPSHLKNFAGCQESYRLRYIEKIQEPPAEALFQGIIQDEACSTVMRMIMDGQNDLSLQTYKMEALHAAERSYQQQVAKYTENVPKWLMRKGFTDYTNLIEAPTFLEWVESHLNDEIEGVQVPCGFDYVTKDGVLVRIEGTADQVLKDRILDQKTSGQKKKDRETGQWIFKDGKEMLVAHISPEYRIQMGCYMRAANKNLATLEYFIKTKMPKFEVVTLQRNAKMDLMIDLYIEQFVNAHDTNTFMPNIYYEWCHICPFHGTTCSVTTKEVQ